MLDKTSHAALEAELVALPQTRIVALRARYRELFGTECPRAFGPDLLRRSIAYRLQENAFGGLDRETARLLNHLVGQLKKTPGRINLPRQVGAGAVLVRHWKGESHRVTVERQGFSYRDQHYETLSQIARLITGTRWNGPRFFGLRTEKAGEAAS